MSITLVVGKVKFVLINDDTVCVRILNTDIRPEKGVRKGWAGFLTYHPEHQFKVGDYVKFFIVRQGDVEVICWDSVTVCDADGLTLSESPHIEGSAAAKIVDEDAVAGMKITVNGVAYKLVPVESP